MTSFVDHNRPGRAILKEIRGKQQVRCGDCLGPGEAPDKHDKWKPCKQCGGAGYVDA